MRAELNRRHGTPLMRVFPCWVANRADLYAAAVWAELHSMELYGTHDQCAPGINFLAETIDCSPTVIKRAIADLESIGALVVTRRYKKTSVYHTISDRPELSEGGQEELELDGGGSRGDCPTQRTVTTCPSLGHEVSTKHELSSDLASSVAPAAPARASGLSTKELIGSFRAAWKACGLGGYAVTGKDRAVLKDHLLDFSSADEAQVAMEERIRWAMRKEFWGEHLCLRSVLEVVANQHSLSKSQVVTDRVNGRSGGLERISDRLAAEMREISSASESMAPSERATLAGSWRGALPKKDGSSPSSDAPTERLGT